MMKRIKGNEKRSYAKIREIVVRLKRKQLICVLNRKPDLPETEIPNNHQYLLIKYLLKIYPRLLKNWVIFDWAPSSWSRFFSWCIWSIWEFKRDLTISLGHLGHWTSDSTGRSVWNFSRWTADMDSITCN